MPDNRDKETTGTRDTRDNKNGQTAPAESAKEGEYKAPKGARAEHELTLPSGKIRYAAVADWILLRKKEKPRAEIFFISYLRSDLGEKEASQRPLTFVFNGGPGASSVYLHLGAMGPLGCSFGPRGEAPAPPFVLKANEASWLEFTDLVFIDPVGTGFSRMIEEEKDKTAKDAPPAKASEGEGSEYWQVKRDLESLGEFIRRYLSKHHRWESPIYVAGESYGGFRSAKLTRMLQQDFGVGLAGAIIISPALEFTLLDGSDYDVLMWLDSFPTMAAAAWIHGRSRKVKKDETLESYLQRAGEFGVNKLLPALAAGDMFGKEQKDRILDQAADYIGMDRKIVRKSNGRIPIQYFVKNLLRDQALHLGLYDASATVRDPYPDRDGYNGPDPTLHQVERVFAAGINTQLRKHIGLETDREYNLLSYEVNRNWKVDTRGHALESQVGATDDLRYGMCLNPDMKVYLCHGTFDLVTPYFAADRIVALMKLSDEQKKRLTVRHYMGGHMFYTWEESRRQFSQDLKAFYHS
jgi:carboxypeptidase C (cathepsin A)